MASRTKAGDLAVIPNGANNDELEHPALPAAAIDPALSGDDAEPGDIALLNVLSQLGDDADEVKVFAYKRDPKTRRMTYLDEFTVEQFNASGFNELREEYGAGDFQIRVQRGGALIANRIVSIGEALHKRGRQPEVDIAAVLREQNTAMLAGFERIASAMATRPAGGGITVDQILKFVPVVLPLLQRTETHNPLNIVRQTVELMKTVQPSGGEGGGEDALLLKALDLFGGPLVTMATQAQAAKTASPALPTLPAPVAPTIPVVNPDPPLETPNSVDEEMTQMMFAYKKLIIGAASSNADPSTYAGLILDHFTDQQINDFFVKDDWFKVVCEYLPEAASHAVWFGELRQVALEMLQAEQKSDSVAGNSATEPGNATQ